MADEDLSAYIDVEPLARLLSTPTYDVDACREEIVPYVREGDGEAGRGVGKIATALKRYLGERLVDHKPALIAQLSYTKAGAFSTAVGCRLFGVFGHPIWHMYNSTRLLDTSSFAIASLMEALHPHGEIDQTARDLVSWIELGDEAARDRLVPVVAKAGTFALRELEYTTEVGARMLEVLALACPTLDDKLDRILANIAAQISHHGHLRSLALFLETHAGPSDAPRFKSTLYTNRDDRAFARATFEVFWRLAHHHRELFDRYAKVFAANFNEDAGLQLLGIIDEAEELKLGKKRWRIMRAGRLVLTTSGDELMFLPRFTAAICATEAAARKSFAKKLDAKRKS